MNSREYYSFEDDPEGIIWKANATPAAYCREHVIPLQTESSLDDDLECPRDGKIFTLKFNLQSYRNFVKELISDSKVKKYKIVRVDNQGSVVIATERNEDHPEYFIESKLSDAQKGLELMILVGKKNEQGKKVQLFVNLPAERLSFDFSDKDKHPAGLFSEITAVFRKSRTRISKK